MWSAIAMLLCAVGGGSLIAYILPFDFTQWQYWVFTMPACFAWGILCAKAFPLKLTESR